MPITFQLLQCQVEGRLDEDRHAALWGELVGVTVCMPELWGPSVNAECSREGASTLLSSR